MNPNYFGDSYDIVKRFFCAELRALGYSVVVKPMFTGDWKGSQEAFLHFVGVSESQAGPSPFGRTALFFDPDTGVQLKSSPKHVSLAQLAEGAAEHALAFAFDQSFSRQHDPEVSMRQKLSALEERGCHAMYYNSHARFLFVARLKPPIAELRNHVVSLGMPVCRFIANGA
jgi:hypothetical protein